MSESIVRKMRLKNVKSLMSKKDKPYLLLELADLELFETVNHFEMENLNLVSTIDVGRNFDVEWKLGTFDKKYQLQLKSISASK